MGCRGIADRAGHVGGVLDRVPRGLSCRHPDIGPSLRLLGLPRLLTGTGHARTLQYRKGWALLAWLACEPGKPRRRAHAATLLWPSLSPAAALTNLRQVLADLNRCVRSTVGDGVLHSDRDSLCWRGSSGPVSDIDHVLSCGRASAGLGDEGLLDMLASGPREGMELLAGLVLDGCEDFEYWLALTRERVARGLATAMGCLRDRLSNDGRYDDAIAVGRRLMQMDACNEEHGRGLMRTLAMTGEYGLALAVFDDMAQALHSELGVVPEPETLAMRAGIIASRNACQLAMLDVAGTGM